ncbi:MAG: lysophospholipid transporter LplT [Burkholderiaceae bacterium]
MKKGFYAVIFAQFFSSLADNALLIATIALLIELASPDWMHPLLKLFFTASYVLLAPFVGAFADAMPKGRAMFLGNLIKIVGGVLAFVGVHPLLAYGLVGLGAAAYSPAKYGILTELLPPSQLVAANGWIEGTSVSSIILGTMLGGVLITPMAWGFLGSVLPYVTSPAQAALVVVSLLYAIAAILNLRIPNTGIRYRQRGFHPVVMMRMFWMANQRLWTDKLGQISLSVTTLFWGAGATLQFIVLRWAEFQLGMTLDEAAILQGVVAIGIAVGALAAAKMIRLEDSCRVLILGALMGLFVPGMIFVFNTYVAIALLAFIGMLAGFFVVPMNALLQHRGHVTLSAGRSIAVQNFNENLNVLFMLAIYAGLLHFNVPINTVIVIFGACVAVAMLLVIVWYRKNQKAYDLQSLIQTH